MAGNLHISFDQALAAAVHEAKSDLPAAVGMLKKRLAESDELTAIAEARLENYETMATSSPYSTMARKLLTEVLGTRQKPAAAA